MKKLTTLAVIAGLALSATSVPAQSAVRRRPATDLLGNLDKRLDRIEKALRSLAGQIKKVAVRGQAQESRLRKLEGGGRRQTARKTDRRPAARQELMKKKLAEIKKRHGGKLPAHTIERLKRAYAQRAKAAPQAPLRIRAMDQARPQAKGRAFFLARPETTRKVMALKKAHPEMAKRIQAFVQSRPAVVKKRVEAAKKRVAMVRERAARVRKHVAGNRGQAGGHLGAFHQRFQKLPPQAKARLMHMIERFFRAHADGQGRRGRQGLRGQRGLRGRQGVRGHEGVRGVRGFRGQRHPVRMQVRQVHPSQPQAPQMMLQKGGTPMQFRWIQGQPGMQYKGQWSMTPPQRGRDARPGHRKHRGRRFQI